MGKRISVYVLGLGITAFGIALIILSKFGAGPWDMVSVGLNKHIGFTIGTWAITQALVVLLTSIIERKRPQWESIAAILIRSVMLDGWLYGVFRGMDFSVTWGMQCLSYSIGVLAVGSGIGIYVQAGFARTPVDSMMIALHNRFGWSLSKARTGIESSALLIGLGLGGPVGLGTFIVALSLGSIVQTTNRWMQRVYHYPKIPVTKSHI